VTDTTGLIVFIAARIADERADAAQMPDRQRTLFESVLRLLESALAEHVPDPGMMLNGEPLCDGCVADAAWPCDFVLQAAALWKDHEDYRPGWRDALEPLSH